MQRITPILIEFKQRQTSMSFILIEVHRILNCGSIPDIIAWFDTKGSNGRACLFDQAIVNGQADVVSALISHGALSQAYTIHPPLHTATEWGHCLIMEMLISAGVDVNSRDLKERTALFLAAHNGREAALRLLIEHGADMNIPDNRGNTPLMQAVRKNQPNAVEALVVLGADKSRREEAGRTAYDMAKSFGRPDSMLARLKP